MLLDDLKYIHSKDSKDAIGHALKQGSQLKDHIEIIGLTEHETIENIVFAAMGGSSLGALLARSWPGCKVPSEIWSRYDTPTYISEKSLVINSSYSGNTEESISALKAAREAGAKVIIITGGGQLIDEAVSNHEAHVILPKTSQPRFGMFSHFLAVVKVLHELELNVQSNALQYLQKAGDFLESEASHWAVDIPTERNPAKKLALELAGTTPIIYTGPEMSPAAYKWKLAFNENAKNLAWCGELPEICHNEFTGWTSHPIEKPFSVVDLRSSYEHPRIHKRFDLSEKLLSGNRPHPHTVEGKGKNTLEHMLYLALFGDIVSLYVAMLNGIDPTPLPYVDKLKKELS